MILPDSNIWIYVFDERLEPAHGKATAWLSDARVNSPILLPALVETEVLHYIARQLPAEMAGAAISRFLAHPGELADLTPTITRRAADLLLPNVDRGIGGRDAAILVHAKLRDATLVTHDQALSRVARDWGLDAHDPVA